MKIRIALAIVALSLVSAAPVLAQTQCNGNFCSIGNTSNSLLGQVYNQNGTLIDFVNALFKMALSLGAILAVVRIAWAGYQYMTSDAFGTKSHAKEILGDAVLGLVLLLSIWLILYQINPEILNLRFLELITPLNSN